MHKTWSLLVAAAILAAGVGLYAYRTMLPTRSVEDAAVELVGLQLPDLSGKRQSLAQWRGKVLIINFWATWCEPCRKEVPVLLRVQAKYLSNGVQIVGISVDSADKVREFANEYRIDYPLVIGRLEVIDLTRKLGNKAGALPYTVVLDRSGTVVKAHLGAISENELESAIRLAGG